MPNDSGRFSLCWSDMRAKLISDGWGFLERILKGWEQFHVPKPLGTNINMNIWVQEVLCVFARTLGFGVGHSLPVPKAVFILVCQITPCWMPQRYNLCGSVQPRGKCQPSAPSAPTQVSFSLRILSPRVTFLFLWRDKAAPWVAKRLVQEQGVLMVWLGSV